MYGSVDYTNVARRHILAINLICKKVNAMMVWLVKSVATPSGTKVVI